MGAFALVLGVGALAKLRKSGIGTGRYVPAGFFNELDYDHTLNYIFAKQFIKNKIVLDVGCGCGYGCNYLAKRGGLRVVGVDISNEAIKFSKRNYATKNLDFAIMDAQHLAFGDNSFDVILTFEVIEHLQNAEAYLSGLVRSLKKGGTCIISTPNKEITSRGLMKPISPFHTREYYPEELRDLLNYYFSKVSILGKRIINKEVLTKASYKRKLLERLLQIDTIKLMARLLHWRLTWKLKRIFMGTCDLKLGDVEICRELKYAKTLIAICKK